MYNRKLLIYRIRNECLLHNIVPCAFLTASEYYLFIYGRNGFLTYSGKDGSVRKIMNIEKDDLFRKG